MLDGRVRERLCLRVRQRGKGYPHPEDGLDPMARANSALLRPWAMRASSRSLMIRSIVAIFTDSRTNDARNSGLSKSRSRSCWKRFFGRLQRVGSAWSWWPCGSRQQCRRGRVVSETADSGPSARASPSIRPRR